ncbi:SDR family NAD(P)-dependent oxidoreductase [Anaerocolumna xylanovorans]|uniref:NAD(P)-dependent dehydrogenase, short-chain alcohol dehydrogenase family n=1 Tax=Anaerocolumna xylanovorans DSM 12503 TaxID=1121345 RepID=A0A1M7XWS0_9FIRM|nr:SDR family NAD(P)-dependent oxidoreductase [Anaerocolumna xylanovorans]SHO43236.1 NAD(P)-dependent dehydrogenase, short-chain alcohol dehydrogenase family [Anaerocolumna xylanovorans DSM 12503]
MGKAAVITGADRGLGLAIVKEFLEKGYLVYAGQYMAEWGELGDLKKEYEDKLRIIPLDVGDDSSVKNACKLVQAETDSIDMLVNNAGIAGSAGDIYELEELERGLAMYNTNCLGALRMVHAFLPLLEKGEEKRLCFVSSEAGSISVCHRGEGFVYPMSKTALNMAVRMLFEELYPKGYTFRLFHPGWVKSYMSGTKSTVGKFEPEESAASACKFFAEELMQEDVLRMYDNEFAVWPF